MDGAPPRLFDRTLARRRLGRAMAGAYPDFLLGRAVEELDARLAVVRRRFDAAIDIGTPTGAVVAALRASGRVDTVLRLAPSRGDARPGDLVGDEEALPFGPGRFDLAVSCLALQGCNDLPGALLQLRRVLRPDGLFVGCLLGGDTLRELRAAFVEADSAVGGGASPRVAPFADVRALGGLLQRAGFALPVVDLDTAVVRYPHPLALMADLRAMGLANALVERRRVPLRRDVLGRALALYAERFADPDGRVRATFDLVWLSGWAPDPSQPKPLRPGSATTRLADALGAREVPLASGGKQG